MSSVCPCRMPWQPVTMGLMMPLMVPSTKVGKNMMHAPMQNGRNSGYTSICSARESACHTREAT